MKTTRTWSITKLHELTNISVRDYNCSQPFSMGISRSYLKDKKKYNAPNGGNR